MTESNITPEQSTPGLREDEKLVTKQIGGFKVVDYKELPTPDITVISGEPWRVVGTGVNSEVQPLVVVENPHTKDLVPVRVDHLFATERLVPDRAVLGIGEATVEQVITLEPNETSPAPTNIQVVEGAQGNER